jgi:hypothetical protein
VWCGENRLDIKIIYLSSEYLERSRRHLEVQEQKERERRGRKRGRGRGRISGIFGSYLH